MFFLPLLRNAKRHECRGRVGGEVLLRVFFLFASKTEIDGFAFARLVFFPACGAAPGLCHPV